MLLVGAAMIPLVGAVGLGVDVVQWVLTKRQLHSAADLAAIAGARALADKQPVGQAVTRSLSYNNFHTYTKTTESPPTDGAFKDSPNHVRVKLSLTQKLPFSNMFLPNGPTITAWATAENATSIPNCVITLDTAGTGVEIEASSSIDFGCGLASNSDMAASSSDTINAAVLSAVGAVTAGTSVTKDTQVFSGTANVADPFASVPQPTVPSPCSPGTWPLIKSNTTYDAALGQNCFQGLQIGSNVAVTLKPGTYYIGEKGISIAGGATLKGSNVTLVLTSIATPFDDKKVGTVTVTGSGQVQLSAPTSGTYKGIIIYQDPRTPAKNNDLTIIGNSGSYFEGAIYAPSTKVVFTGNSGVDTKCMQVVSMWVQFTGNTNVKNDCPSGSGAASFGTGGGTVRLVE